MVSLQTAAARVSWLMPSSKANVGGGGVTKNGRAGHRVDVCSSPHLLSSPVLLPKLPDPLAQRVQSCRTLGVYSYRGARGGPCVRPWAETEPEEPEPWHLWPSAPLPRHWDPQRWLEKGSVAQGTEACVSRGGSPATQVRSSSRKSPCCRPSLQSPRVKQGPLFCFFFPFN